jgi:SAM-dependent methyltransferase
MTTAAYTYGLPPNYRCNCPPAHDTDSLRTPEYWTSVRVTLSHYYQHAVYSYAHNVARTSGARTIYDIGCGPATKLLKFFDNSFTLFGVDTPEAISYCRAQHPRGTFFTADLDSPNVTLPDDAPRADLIICADVIEHLEYPEHLLSFITSTLAPGGTFIISTPDRDALYSPGNLQPSNPEHIREWNMQEFANFLTSHNISVIHQHLVSSFRLGLNLRMWKQALSYLWRRTPIKSTQLAVCVSRT